MSGRFLPFGTSELIAWLWKELVNLLFLPLFFKDRSILLQEILQRNLGFDIRFCLISWIGCLNHLDVQKRVNWEKRRPRVQNLSFSWRFSCVFLKGSWGFHFSDELFLVSGTMPNAEMFFVFAALQVSWSMIFSETARGTTNQLLSCFFCKITSRYDICFVSLPFFQGIFFGNFENISPDYQFASCLPYWTFRSVQES